MVGLESELQPRRSDDVAVDVPAASPEELLRLRLAVEASGEVIFMTNARGTITYVNPEFVRVYGYAPAEIVGRSTPRILKSGITNDAEYRAFWRRLAGNEVVRREFVNRTKSGSLVQVESSANPIVADGRLVGFLAVQRDITARKADEAALRESEMRYRTLAEAAHDSIFIVDRDARIEYANGSSTAPFGVRSDDAIGKRLHDVFPRETADEMWRQLSKVFTTGLRQRSEDRFDTGCGEIWMDTSLVPMSMHGGRPDAVMGIARDVTERKRLEQQFLQAQKMEALGRLAGGIAHDFNNLLTAILGYSELLLDRLSADPGLAADVHEIQKAGERAGRLTRQLLAFSRKQVLMPQVLDLNEVVGELHKLLRRVIGEDVRIAIAPAARLDRVKADPSQIEQVLLNLAVNARDAMPQGGSLRIATDNVTLGDDVARDRDGLAPGRYVAISVHDTGCGMTGDVVAHAFEPFFTTKAAGKGTGLGLATVYGVVKQCGGYVAIDSSLGVGTTVTTYLPAVSESLPAPEPDECDGSWKGGTETILLVEDEPGVRELMRRTLAQQGYNVLNTQSSTEALSIAENHDAPIDMILSDIVMPGLSGPDLGQRVVAVRPRIKLLFVSGFPNHFSVGPDSMSPRAAFLPKPFSTHMLAMKVRECLDKEC